MDENPRLNPWRVVALGFGALLFSLAVLTLALFFMRKDLLLLMEPSAEGPPVAQAPVESSPLESPPPPPVLAVPEAPETRKLDWSKLEIGEYRGSHHGTYECDRFVATLDKRLEKAVKELMDASGLYPTAENRILITLLDAEECSFDGPYDLSLSGDPAEGGAIRVEMALEPLVLQWYPARLVLAAALAEGILSKEVTGFSSAPSWFRHGIALHLAGFGPTLQQRQLIASDAAPLQRIQPLMESGEDAWLNGYWAFRALESRHGYKAILSVIGSLRLSGDWRKAAASQDGSFESFESSYRTWAKAYLRGLCANRESLEEMINLLRQEEEAEALPHLREFIKEHPLDIYTGEARYFLGYVLYRTGEYDEAVYALSDLLNNAPETTSRQGKAHYFLGRCYQIQGYFPLAIERYHLARMEPDNALLDKLTAKYLREVE